MPRSSVSIPFAPPYPSTEIRRVRVPWLLNWGLRCLSLLLASLACFYSGLCAWTLWELQQPGFTRLQVERAHALGLPVAAAWLQLADRDAMREKEYLLNAIQEDPRSSDALIRLALLAEIERDLPAAAGYYIAAAQVDKRYPIFLAAASFGARTGEQMLVSRFAQLAFQYRPRDLFNLFAVLAPLSTAGKTTAEKIVLQLASLPQQIEFLYFLIGQEQYDRAFDFQNLLPPAEGGLETPRRELSERHLLHGDSAKAWRLWRMLDPAAQPGQIQNARFETKPLSLAFDWRLTNDKRAGFDAQPGAFGVSLSELAEPLEVMSQILYAPGIDGRPRVDMDWQGDLSELEWRLEGIAGKEGLLRLSLLAKPGPARRFRIADIRFKHF